MTTFSFRGFQDGASVSISATQGINSDSASVATWNQSGSTPITSVLSGTRTSGTAPCGAIFYNTATSPAGRVESPYHDIESEWAFSDPGNFTALQNNPIWGTDRNIAFGPRATHVFEGGSVGTVNHTVTCQSHDGENIPVISTLNFAVNDPNTVFVGADTAVVSQTSDFSGAPSGASQFTTIAAALSHLSGRTNARLLLRAGETFNQGIAVNETGGSGRKLQIGRFGEGAKPILQPGSSRGVNITNGTSSHDEIAIWGLRIEGPYDPTATSQPTNQQGGGITLSQASEEAHKTLYDLEVVNSGGAAVNCATGANQRNIYVANCRFIGWLDYGFFIPDCGRIALSGTTVQQPTGTVNGDGKFTAPYYPDHGPLRLSRPDGVFVVSNCDFASLNSWSHDGIGRTYQPCIRWNAGDNLEQECVIDRFRYEGGSFRLYNETAAPSRKTAVWALADRVFGVDTDHANEALKVELGGTTVRNSVFVVPQTPPGTGIGLRDMFGDDGGGNTAPGWNTRRSEVYSCAFVDLRTDAQAAARGGSNNRDFRLPTFENISPNFFGNNIAHAPNMTTGGETGDAPLNTTARWTPITDGERWETDPVDTSRDPGPEVTASFAPLTGSTAIGGATGKVSLMDINGDLRSDILAGLSRTTPSEGPLEPPLES